MNQAQVIVPKAARGSQNPDLDELLHLIVKIGHVAERLLKPKAAESSTAPVKEKAITIDVPEDFSIGQAKYEDNVPESRRWYTPHARDQLIERYGVSPQYAYRTLQYVMQAIQGDEKAVFLYDGPEGKVFAVDIFGEVGYVMTDREGQVLVTFYPKAVRNNNEVQKQPQVRARLLAFENAVLCAREGHVQKQRRERLSAYGR